LVLIAFFSFYLISVIAVLNRRVTTVGLSRGLDT
jgi:hypothetical protein